MDVREMRRRVSGARVGRLATVGASGAPHVVPVCFAVVGEAVVTAVDAKPKRGGTLQRVANITATGRAALLVDEYDEDWTRLWWVRVDARGRLVNDPADAVTALRALAAKYPQYAAEPPPGPVIELSPLRWSAWQARPHQRLARTERG